MLGYYNRPADTAAAIRDGWFHTGDLGYQDEEGYFFITGRSKEMIALSTGKKIFPDELEKFYKQIPSIKEICIIQTERGIEAAVVPDFDYLRRMNLSNSREVIAFEIEDLAKELPPYKRISGLKVFKDSFPVTRLGKLKRSQVKELYLKSGERAEKQIAEIDKDLLSTPVARKLLACLGPFTEKKNIVPDDNLELDLGLDSLARVELVVSLEHSFGIRLPESFGSGIFTVKDAVLKLQDVLSLVPMKSGEQHVRLSWAEILGQEPGQEVKQQLELDSGWLCSFGKYLLRSLVMVFFRAYNHLSVHGLENLPANGPFIIAPNHLSLADAPAVMAAMPWRQGSQTFFLGTTTYFGGPLTSRIAKIVQVIPVDMESRLHGALQLSAYVLRRRKILCVFPEGSRSRDGRTKEFKKGVGIVARELNIPIIPVGITGTYEALAPGKKLPRPEAITVKFGKPVYPGDLDYEGIVRKLSDEVINLLERT
jgi:long-chain acyl-CoA synthetase